MAVCRGSTFAATPRSPRWLESTLSGGEPMALAWIVILAFLRITTRPGWSAQPISVDAAFSVVESWLNHPSVSIVHPGSEHPRILRSLLTQAGVAGDLTTDAHLAALAIEHGAELASADHDFARFSGLRWNNPLRH